MRKAPSLVKNALYDMDITGMTAEGFGVGRAEGVAVFVPGAAVGDRLRVRIVKPLKTYSFGRLEEILSGAPSRREPDCSVYRPCGGCAYRHISYDEELRVKRALVDDCLRRVGGLSLQTEEILCARNDDGSPRTDRYRNKAQYPLSRVGGHAVGGFYAPHSHRVVPTDTCPLAPEPFDRALRAVTGFLDRYAIPVYDEESGDGIARHLYLRYAESDGAVLATLVVNAETLPHAEAFVETLRQAVPETTGILLSVNRERTNVVLGRRFVPLWGEPYIEDTLCGLRFRLAPDAFYQVNRRGAELLYRKAAEFAALRPTDTLLDLYCGAGTIGLSMASGVSRVMGVEIVESAVENARENARRNGIQNAEFRCMDAGAAAESFAKEGLHSDVIVVDPPRKGCDERTLRAVAEMDPGRMVYVSCDPATLARDLKRLEELGFTAERAAAVDMFPRTGHVETVCLLARHFSD